MNVRTIATSAVIAAAAMVAPASASLVINGSFETAGATAANSANWNELGGTGATVSRVSGNASNGSFAEQLDAQGQTNVGTAATLQQITSQTTPTGDLPVQGTVYTLSFDVKPITFVGANLNYQLGYFVNGTGVVDVNQGNDNALVGGSPYQTQTLQSQAAPAGASGFFIQFTSAAGADPSLSANVIVDNVQITAPATPEPASATLMALAGVGLLRRTRRH